MDTFYKNLKLRAQGINPDYFPFVPKSHSYHDKVIFYCGAGIILSFLVSFGFHTSLKSTLILGIGVPLGYFHKDLMNLILHPEYNSDTKFLIDDLDIVDKKTIKELPINEDLNKTSEEEKKI